MEQVYIETQDLSVGYHGKALLKDIALKVKKGEILVLIGPNGAGKSTLMNVLSGQYHTAAILERLPTRVKSVSLKSLMTARQKVSLLFTRSLH